MQNNVKKYHNEPGNGKNVTNMYKVREECNIIRRVRKDMFKETDRSRINMVYKQARTWNRFHHFLGEGCSYETYRYLNSKFKALKAEAIQAIN